VPRRAEDTKERQPPACSGLHARAMASVWHRSKLI
jgi:hypothetical protein